MNTRTIVATVLASTALLIAAYRVMRTGAVPEGEASNGAASSPNVAHPSVAAEPSSPKAPAPRPTEARRAALPFASAARQRQEAITHPKDAGVPDAKAELKAADDLFRQKRYDKAFPLYLDLAQKGQRDAMNRIGECYHFGQGVAVDYAQAMEWYEKAFVAGDDSAPMHIGRLYNNGEGVEKDQAEAFKWYQHGAMRGNPSGMHWMANYHLEGKEGVEGNRLKSYVWLSLIKERDKAGGLKFLYQEMPELSPEEEGKVDAVRAQISEDMKAYADQ